MELAVLVIDVERTPSKSILMGDYFRLVPIYLVSLNGDDWQTAIRGHHRNLDGFVWHVHHLFSIPQIVSSSVERASHSLLLLFSSPTSKTHGTSGKESDLP